MLEVVLDSVDPDVASTVLQEAPTETIVDVVEDNGANKILK